MTTRLHRPWGGSSIVMTVALRVATVTALVGAIVFALVYAGLAQQSRRALLATIDTDVAGLVDTYDAQGAQGLVKRLDDRMALTPTLNEQPWYLVQDATGKTLAGNVATWPALKPELSETGPVNANGHGHILARVTLLRGGLRLLVGRSTALADNTLSQVRMLFAGGLVAIVLSAFLIGLMAALRLRARVGDINRVFDSLRDGGVDVCAPISTRGDEIDQLSGHVNAVLQRVDRLMAAQRDISDNIAHETRTPLMGLNQRLDEAIEQSLDPAVVSTLQAAQDQVKSLLRLLDALLDIASAEAQRGDVRSLGEINLSEVARSLVDLYTPSIEDAGLALVTDIADEVLVRADAMQMSRLLVNLFDNAIKYAGSTGSTLRFSVKTGPVIVFEDDGPGIAEVDRSRIFGRYQRGSDGKGHGLGLALVAAIAARHTMTVRIESAGTGTGARFVVAPKGWDEKDETKA